MKFESFVERPDVFRRDLGPVLIGRSGGPALKTYRVTLTSEERQQLQAMIAAGKAAAQALAHARILLKADQADGGPAWPDRRRRPDQAPPALPRTSIRLIH
jgi:hypothetical protein